MADSADETWSRTLRALGTTAFVIAVAPKVLAYLNRQGQLTRRFDQLAEQLDQTVGWDRLPTWASVLTLLGLRRILRRANLYATNTPASAEPPAPPTPDASYLAARTADGTYNDLDHPWMG